MPHASYSARQKRIRRSMKARGLDAFLVTGPENRRYLSGFSPADPGLDESSGALLILGDEAVLLTDGRYRLQAEAEVSNCRVHVYRKGLPEGLKSTGADIHTMGYEPRFMTCERLESLKKALPGVKFLSFPGKVEGLRSIKEPWEVEVIQEAVRAAEEVLVQVAGELRAGMTEKQVAWRILEGLHRNSDGPSFPPIVASGPNAALPHAVPTEREIRPGDPVIIDMGARIRGYCSDMTRTVFAGEPDDRMKEIFKVVQAAQEAAQGSVAPGRSGREIDAVARKIISDAGYGRYFVHGLGHGVGLQVHEAPALSPRYRKHLRPGMVTTVEPGIYLPGTGGVRLENMVLVQVGGNRPLNRLGWLSSP